MDRSIEEFVAGEVEALGFELIKLETVQRGRRTLLRLYIDHAEHGVTIDDCVNISKAVGFALDGEDLIRNSYNLEVSSPGMNRPLTKAAHFRRFVGKQARIEHAAAGGGSETLIGTILEADEREVALEVAGERRTIDIAMVRKANLHGEHWEIPGAGGGGKKRRRRRTK
jgi:ribosome maturation factor RimP